MASFDENGKYIKTNWKAGDKITATKLNKIEESIEAVNDNDISRHVEADARLDALEAKDVAHDKEFTNVKNLIADNKAAAELGDYEINSRMTFLENELNEGIEEVHNVAETVDGKIATAEANMTAQVNQGKADMEAMVAEVEADLEGLHAKDEELSEQLADIKNLNINILDFKELIIDNDYTNALNTAIESAEHGDKIIFPNANIILSDTITINKGITIDFGYSTIVANVDGNDVFNLEFTGENNRRIKLMNFNFIGNDITPNNIIKINGSINTIISGNFFGVKAMNSIIHNYKGYGTRIKSEVRYCQSPRAIYLSSSNSDVHSFDIGIDCDITGQAGIGIEMEGGTIDIKGVVEGCSEGGIYYNGVHNLNSCNLQLHCESNKKYDIKLGKVERASDGSWGIGEVNIVSSLFGVNSTDDFKSILYGSHINLNIINSTGVKGYMISSDVRSSCINIIGRGNCEENTSYDVIVNKIYGNTVNLSNITSQNISNSKKITTARIDTKQIVSVDDAVTLYTDDQSIQFSSNNILPATSAKTDIGGRWNIFNNVYTRYIVMMSPNGTCYQISVSDTGELKVTAL